VSTVKKAKTYKAEAFDILQYFYGTVHDPIIHGLFRFGGRLDASVLTQAVTLSMDAVPMLRCGFDGNARRPRWTDRGLTGEDAVCVINPENDAGEEALRLLASALDVPNGPQLRIYLVRGGAGDTLALLMNHMVCDGGGLKDYIYLLAELYTRLAENADDRPALPTLPRSGGQLFRGMGIRRRLRVLFSGYDASALKLQEGIRLEGDGKNPFFVTRTLSRDEFLAIKDYAKSRGVTFNDMLVAAYIRVLGRRTGKQRLVLPCPADLRKYMRGGARPGFCNLSSNYFVDIAAAPGDAFDDTLRETASQLKRQKESDGCLKSVLLWETVCRVLPFQTIKRNFGRLFTIPVVSFSNLGVLDGERLRFGETAASDAFLTGAVKYAPYFQVAVSTYRERSTLTCNMHGTENDSLWIGAFLEELTAELTGFFRERGGGM
jgi:NRPS condensation-like uncharacterized protein